VVVACLGLTACSKPADPVTVHLSVPTTSARQASAEQASAVWTVATAVGHSVAVHRQPDGPMVLRLANPNADGAPLVFLVEQQRPRWLRVLLPVRPNGASGWIPADAVTLSKTGYHIDVYLTAHRIVVSDGARVVDDEPIGAGRANTPTPGGEYYITELLQQPAPNGPYGPYAYGLCGSSTCCTPSTAAPGWLASMEPTTRPDSATTSAMAAFA
jgi:hypothetical protein